METKSSTSDTSNDNKSTSDDLTSGIPTEPTSDTSNDNTSTSDDLTSGIPTEPTSDTSNDNTSTDNTIIDDSIGCDCDTYTKPPNFYPSNPEKYLYGAKFCHAKNLDSKCKQGCVLRRSDKDPSDNGSLQKCFKLGTGTGCDCYKDDINGGTSCSVPLSLGVGGGNEINGVTYVFDANVSKCKEGCTKLNYSTCNNQNGTINSSS